MNDNLEPTWQTIEQLPISLSPIIKKWLTAEVSLTAKLREFGEFNVQVLEEDWGRALANEQRILAIEQNTPVRYRDVVLQINHIPIGVAHTIIPAKAIKAIPQLEELGNRSLGDLIFHELQGKRQQLEFAEINSDHALFLLAQQFCNHADDKLWARRSLLTAKKHGLLVNEIFFPTLWELESRATGAQ